ncbi:MAG: hypothetical protein AAGD25_14420 [Cyanobacteria bacterium P01_F01_bin.150]
MRIQELKALIKESVREVLQEERFLRQQALIPFVSDKEQAELEKIFDTPADYDKGELIDMTEWVKHGGPVPKISD